MENRKSLLKRPNTLLVLSVILILYVGILGTVTHSAKDRTDENTRYRSDVLVIDGLKSFGPLERPGVVFLHDRHTDALVMEGKDCKTCHPSEKTGTDQSSKTYLSLKFKRLQDNSKKEGMDLYHAECIGCHQEIHAVGKKTGPIEICGECHQEKSDWESNRLSVSFDQSLHFRHTEANPDEKTKKGDCSRCHHEYDEKTKKLFYAQGKEGSCRYCHLKETEENRISMRSAAHLACIECHQTKKAAKKESGPVQCSGCHDPDLQKKIEKIEKVPRIERKQPDIVLIRSRAEEPLKNNKDQALRMYPVPFDHKAHEAANDTCRVCHHAALESCSRNCHTPQGSEAGKWINLARAMHLRKNGKSCIGCHQNIQAKPECAACHRVMTQELNPSSNCEACHVTPIENGRKEAVLIAAESDEKRLAEELRQYRKTLNKTYTDEDIPEKVVINILSDQYEPVDMPHRKMVRAILARIKNDTLASYFHMDEGAVCQGCHHNSPASNKPPRCVSCHGKPFDDRDPLRPGIKAAYHRQCMQCHETLSLEKPKSTGCTECHKEKGKFQISVFMRRR